MTMIINEITKQSDWQKFFDADGSSTFLQSWEWGEMEQKLGNKILRLGIYIDNNLCALAQVIKMRMKRGNFLFIPHGPVIQNVNNEEKSILESLTKYLIELAKKDNYHFIRIASPLKNTPENLKIFKELRFKTSPIYLNSENFWILPLDGGEEKILSGMRKTTRYLIKKAQRDGVIIEKLHNEKAVDEFMKIYAETAAREKFAPYSKKYIQEEFETFNKSNKALFLGGRIAGSSDYSASALIIFTKNSGFYHQGASLHTKEPVTYLLQWEAIKEAKKRGCKFYNFWGILQKGRTPKDWQGLTLFKTGFGGNQVEYVPTQDYIVSPKYYITYIYEKYLSWKRGI